MKPENWIPLGWLPILDNDRSLRPTQGYEGCPARNARLFHECWRNFLSNWDTFSKKHRIVIYSDGIARESMHFIAGLLGDQQVYLVDISHLLYLFCLLHIAYLSHLLYLKQHSIHRIHMILMITGRRSMDV